ncbi:hypothetical protein TBR22_A42840 [Luteitalea sp. TBR-22]|uniref:bifunctional lysylphosphatidylglycerol flippase/synthetase MprF n=1 Tax=Luteitalea sp. TBR-22 TaxID=2802971 RepID=UPI001AF5C9F9|nr:bifunctional lysylphosphatidylglycerol flippase/synthetase MprF [Luteitalea sp. TBR-22]BCS35058.1 hypothetical protein TBR22_A42840 [Luteitalea sp. TBR-22]
MVSDRMRRAAPIAVSLVLLLAALDVLRLELRMLAWHDVSAAVRNVPPSRLGLAVLLTALNYLALTGYDVLAFAYIGKRRPTRHIAAVSFLAYAVSNSLGLAMLSGASVRYRFYTRWGVTAEELGRIVFSYSVTFWLGLLAMGGVSLIATRLPAEVPWVGGHALAPVGCVLALLPVSYVIAAVRRRRPLRVWRLQVTLPSPRLALAQLGLSMLEWTLAGTVLYVLLPAGSIPFLPFLGLFLAAVLVGMVSHVPGGLGVFEGLMVLLTRPYLPSAALLPSLVAFRAVYYLLPLSIALVGLVVDEARQRRGQVARLGKAAGRVTVRLTPAVLAVFTFAAGLMLLLSGATPTAPGRLQLLHQYLPLSIIEASHFVGSLVGAGLVVLAQGVARRLDAAYYAVALAIVTGMVTSLLKGFGYEEAALLLLVLALLRVARPAFDRPASFFDTRFSPPWIAAVVGAVGASVWLGLFAFDHVDYSHELWWQFELQGGAPRFLRASVGAAVVIALVALRHLTSRAPYAAPPATDADLIDADRVIAAQSATSAFLALLGDKSLMFNDTRSAFIMYAVQGRTWVAFGDPVGPPSEAPALIHRFLDRCADFGGVPVFYEIGKTRLHMYVDLGLGFVKLGEEGCVDLARFSLEGGRAAKHRQALRRLEKAGAAFRIVESPDVASVIDQLRAVSDDWLAAKAGAEKGFSLGFFDPRYLRRFPIAVVERDGRILAFANLLPGADRQELSIDLMRYHRDAPTGVMEALLVHLLVWGRAHGYRRFMLGMAPLSGVEASPIGPLWHRFGAFVYEHGEAAYHFQGLRAYKEKFDPVWEPRYLAYPGGFRLARILADVSALIAGGYRHIFGK